MAFQPGLYITVFADASFCHKTKAAGFGGWVKHGEEGSTVRLSGELSSVDNSSEAEFLAVIATLEGAKNNGVIFEEKIVVIQTDCEDVIRRLREKLQPDWLTMAKDVKLKHVKGHQGFQCKRSAVNTFCDREARKHMRKQRAGLLQKSG